jgi:hypothetical protein
VPVPLQDSRGDSGNTSIQDFEKPLVGSSLGEPANSRDQYWRSHIASLYAPPSSNAAREAFVIVDDVQETDLSGDLRHLSIETVVE